MAKTATRERTQEASELVPIMPVVERFVVAMPLRGEKAEAITEYVLKPSHLASQTIISSHIVY